ncbi:efflux transporter outer membrane subunit [Burkholderia sp. Ac-20365]|uniref:efflux transporter outer membrane subunit n=1 Tax=Burkholderia sp. Ac-20365 TaxID=2703897 RepID=UPI00197BF678|nr:efflux transporter outer membrane subunit [Burkholderia sp. Ac-20365]MBN3759257.1 efflux transporter outer membrane subunit [Burkholderia sp. Ac-20365]
MSTIRTNRVLLGPLSLLATLAFTAGCSLAPEYRVPAAASSSAFKEASATKDTSDATTGSEIGTWKIAQPADQIPRGEWWRIFDDATLNDFEEQALSANQNLVAASARVKEARAIQQATSANLFPTIGAGFGPTREKVSPGSQFSPNGVDVPAQTLWRAQGTVSYEADLFGRVSDSVKASRAESEESEALLRSVQLALQADVAVNYFSVREVDAQLEVYVQNVSLREQALKLVQSKFGAGDITELDLARARAELATARSDEMTARRERATAEHRLAVLLGKSASEFSMASNPLRPVQIRIPPGLPSALLERRPDIAAAERAMAAANARIGVAKAAYFPSLSITGSAGFESTTLGDLFQWSSRAFVLGPLFGTALTMPIFDGGRRAGNLANARAAFDEDVANYRQQVLKAFQEVEDSLSDLRILEEQTQTQNEAVQASTRAAHISRTQYREGAVNYLDVIDADRTVLAAQTTAVQLSGLQAAATVNLVRALGGGWGDGVVVGVADTPQVPR